MLPRYPSCRHIIRHTCVYHRSHAPFNASLVPPTNTLFKFYCRFFTHAFANAVVCVTGAKAIWTVFSDPHDAMDFRIYHDTSPFGSASVWYVCISEPHQQQQHHYIFPLRIFISIFLHLCFYANITFAWARATFRRAGR